MGGGREKKKKRAALRVYVYTAQIPAALLNVKPGHSVLDLCAAPGSKTTQLLEAIHRHDPGGGSGEQGLVVANDLNPRRYVARRRTRNRRKNASNRSVSALAMRA